MRVIVCHEHGNPAVLRIENHPDPGPPGRGQVSIALSTWGVSYVDMLMVTGGYQLKPQRPFIPGIEAAGVISAVGSGVDDYQAGDRVMIKQRFGAFAEQTAISAEDISPVPDNLSLSEAAAFQSIFNTAYHALVQGGRLQQGEVVLIHGAGGGVGHAAVQVAKQLGATVIAATSSDAKLNMLMHLGADHVIDYRNFPDGFRNAVKALTGERGVDVVFDPVGGAVFDESMRCLNWGARLLIIGFTAGCYASARTNHLLIKGASAIGIRAGEFARRNPAIARENQRRLMQWASDGKIKPYISHVLPFEQIAAAMQLIIERKVPGRVVINKQ